MVWETQSGAWLVGRGGITDKWRTRAHLARLRTWGFFIVLSEICPYGMASDTRLLPPLIKAEAVYTGEIIHAKCTKWQRSSWLMEPPRET